MSTASNNAPLLDVASARIDVLDHFTGRPRAVLEDFDLRLFGGQAIGITGLSGSGKSSLALALAGLHGRAVAVRAKHWRWRGKELAKTAGVDQKDVRRRVDQQLMLIQQDARSSLVPYKSVKWHLRNAGAATGDALQVLRDYRFSDPLSALRSLPASLSTGECQRVQLGMARLRRPMLLIADEPFSSLNDTLRQDFVATMTQFLEAGNCLILISHVLDVLRRLTHEAIVLCNGRVAERGPAKTVLSADLAQHPHTRLLLALETSGPYALTQSSHNRPKAGCVFHVACHLAEPEFCQTAVPPWRRKDDQSWCCNVPRAPSPLGAQAEPARAPTKPPLARGEPLLKAKNVKFRFGQRRLDAEWSFDLSYGDRLGLLAPSGAGKSTLARAILGLVQPAEGSIERFGATTNHKEQLSHRDLRSIWRRIQLVPQDTDLTFDPASLVGEALGQAWRVADPAMPTAAAWQRSEELFAELHLPTRLLYSPPQLLSGGERRRAAVAYRLAALGYLLPGEAATPRRILIIDEPTVGLDEFMQARLAAVLLQAATALDLTYLVISHDWRFVERFCTSSMTPKTGGSESKAA